MRVGGWLRFSKGSPVYLDFPQRSLTLLFTIIKTQIFDRIDQTLHVLLPLWCIVKNIEEPDYQERSVLSRFGKALCGPQLETCGV
jgi:hypothetical protein